MGLVTDPRDYLDNWQSFSELIMPELPHGWAGQVVIDLDTENFMWLLTFRERSEWITQNIKNYEQNVIWARIGSLMYAQFRKQKDLAWFSLRWC